MAAKHAGSDTVIRGDLIIWVIVAVDHQLARFCQQIVAVSAQVAQLDGFASILVFAGYGLNRLQR